MNRFYYSLYLFVYGVLTFFNPIQAQSLVSNAKQAFQHGNYEQAIVQWQTALTKTLETRARFQAQLGIIQAYRRLGAYEQALEFLNATLPVIEQTGDTPDQILLLNELSKLHLSQGEKWYDKARQQGETALNLARKSKNPQVLAEVLNHWGNLFAAEYDYDQALATYREALSYFDKSNLNKNIDLYRKISINQLKTRFMLDFEQAHQFKNKKQAFQASIAALELASQQASQNWQDVYSQSFGLITLSKIAQQIQAQLTKPLAYLSQVAYQALAAARDIAERLDNPTAKAHVYGYLGQLYEKNKRYEEALLLTRQAVFFAQQTRKQPLLYYWQWQLGRLLKQQNHLTEAILVYQQAVDNLGPVRLPVATTGYFNMTESFREQVAPVYFELADLLLQQARSSQSVSEREKWLRQARKTIESFKKAELQDYFKSDCVDIQSECTNLEQILDAKTAVLYPIPLHDRLELLLNLPNGLIQATVPVNDVALGDKIASFLSSLHQQSNIDESFDNQEEERVESCTPLSTEPNQPIEPVTESFLENAHALYHWLIEPVASQLTTNNIDTLVIIPDGPLRTIPFSALHDGQQFLVQKYALAIAPGLCLSEPEGLRRGERTVLLAGLSKAVQGFSSLPCAEYELDRLHKLFASTQKPLLNEDFTISNLHTNINQADYSIVHIASHGQFSANLKKTFILTHDGQLSMDRLERLMSLTTIHDKPVELLTLSACETAVGDDRAALGLAGVALKAGVKSALASLWKVDDEATPTIIIEFYRQLLDPTLSKAKALQQAQNKMLTDKNYIRFRHPYYWSAFLLIGNWL